MIQIIKQTREEKIAMYLKLSKKELAEMLVNCNEAIDYYSENQKPQYIKNVAH